MSERFGIISRVMKCETETELGGLVPFYFYRTNKRAFVYGTHYSTARKSIRAAYDVNRMTGLLTCIIPKKIVPPKLHFFKEHSMAVIRPSDSICLVD